MEEEKEEIDQSKLQTKFEEFILHFECPICMENTKEFICAIPCGHLYSKDCTLELLNKKCVFNCEG